MPDSENENKPVGGRGIDPETMYSGKDLYKLGVFPWMSSYQYFCVQLKRIMFLSDEEGRAAYNKLRPEKRKKLLFVRRLPNSRQYLILGRDVIEYIENNLS